MASSLPAASPPPHGLPPGGTPTLRNRLAAVGLALVGAALAVLVVLAWQRSASAMRVQTVSSSIVDASKVSVTFSVRVDPKARVSCEIQAKAADTTTVGSATVELEPVESQTRTATVVVPTRLPAVRGEAVSCRGVMT